MTAYNVNINQKLGLTAFLVNTSFVKGSISKIFLKTVLYIVVDILYQERDCINDFFRREQNFIF